MKVVIIGSGAMGSLFGGLLAENNVDVWLFDIWREHIEKIIHEGLSIEQGKTTRQIQIHATINPGDIKKSDLAIIFVKSIHTRAAAETAEKLLTSTGMALTLQNGMGNADVISEIIGVDRVIAGTTSHGATLLGPGKIRHAGIGPTVIGMWSGRPVKVLNDIAVMFNHAGIQTKTVGNVKEIVWKKLFINVGINAVTALTGIKNGEILDLGVTRSLCRNAVEEAVAVARALNITVEEDVVEQVFQVAKATALNRSSMGQDVDNGRQTEIDAINGAVIREAQKADILVPVNQTLTSLIETMQAHF